MRKSIRRLSGRFAIWLLAGGVGFGVYSVYRWAEPSPASLAAAMSSAPANPINLELEEASFENYADGRKNWALLAGRIILERPPNGGAANSLQSAEIVDIRDGKLYGGGASGHNEKLVTPTPASSTLMTQASVDASAGIPSATFSAQHGYYSVNNAAGIPSDMLLSYTVQWQFRLLGDVKIRTREGYRLNAPAITIVELFHRRTGRLERQMLCDQGARVVAKGANLLANRARYSDSAQTVECLGGVRGALGKDSVQAETMYWSLKQNTLRCPDSVSGLWQNTNYTAQDVLIDVTRQAYTGKNLDMQLNQSVTSKLAAGSLGLVLATGIASQGQVPAPNTGKASKTSPSAAQSPIDDLFDAADWKIDSKTNIATGHHFKYTRGNRVITGDNGRYDQSVKENNILDADGHLVMDEPEHHVTAQKVHVDEKKALAVLTGEVVLTLKPAPNASNTAPDKDNGIETTKNQGAVVTCDQVDSFYRKKFTKLSGHLVFKQHILRPGKEPLDRTVTAEHAEYDSKKEILVLFPPVKGEDSEGRKFSSETNPVTIITKQGEESISGIGGGLILPVQDMPDSDEAPETPPAKPITKPDEKKPAPTQKIK